MTEELEQEVVEEETKPVKKTTRRKTTAKKEEPKERPFEVLIRMVRQNPVFEVSGPSGRRYLFSKAHPYQLVSDKEDAEVLLEIEGLELASPDQVERFYS